MVLPAKVRITSYNVCYTKLLRSDSYGRAILVGLLNTVYVSLVGIFFATIFGIILGVARLSTNFLVAKLAAIYLEILRNIPLLVLLVFWYGGVFITLPRVRESIQVGSIYLSNRGVAVPWGIPSDTWSTYLIVLGAGLVAAIIVAWRLKVVGERTGRPPVITSYSIHYTKLYECKNYPEIDIVVPVDGKGKLTDDAGIV